MFVSSIANALGQNGGSRAAQAFVLRKFVPSSHRSQNERPQGHYNSMARVVGQFIVSPWVLFVDRIHYLDYGRSAGDMNLKRVLEILDIFGEADEQKRYARNWEYGPVSEPLLKLVEELGKDWVAKDQQVQDLIGKNHLCIQGQLQAEARVGRDQIVIDKFMSSLSEANIKILKKTMALDRLREAGNDLYDTWAKYQEDESICFTVFVEQLVTKFKPILEGGHATTKTD